MTEETWNGGVGFICRMPAGVLHGPQGRNVLGFLVRFALRSHLPFRLARHRAIGKGRGYRKGADFCYSQAFVRVEALL